MIVILCADDRYGVKFNRRRQSRDQMITKKILQLCKGSRLYMSNYSAPLFDGFEREYTGVEMIFSEDYMKNAGQDEFCFNEDGCLREYKDKIEKIIMFRWNKVYPADCYLDFIPAEKEWKKISFVDFKGKSHDMITMEVYENEKNV